MKNLENSLRYSLYLLLLTCALARGQEPLRDTLYMKNYLMLTINTNTGEEGFMVVGDTVKAVLFEINRLESRNEMLRKRLDNCWESQVIQSERNVEIFQDMLKLFEE